MISIYHSTDPNLLRGVYPHLTIEAEYGSDVVEGQFYTAAHHQPSGPYAGDHVVEGGRPAPCNDTSIPVFDATGGGWVFGVSHLDLDTIGGCLRGWQGHEDLFAGNDGFWRLAAFVDVNGAHKLHLSGASTADLARLDAWWAYFKTLPRLAPGTVNDVTGTVEGCASVLREILAGNEARIEAGRVFRAAEAALNAASFVELRGGVIVRRSPQFVNHLYTAPDGTVGRAVAAHGTETGAVTLSLESPVQGVSCRDIVQGLWGPLAGGHAGIAGSPRNDRLDAAEFDRAVNALVAALG